MSTFFKAFNSLQITGVFAAFPFLLSWLYTATFPASIAILWIASIIYAILFILMAIAVLHALDSD
jgi:hypothetical protein